MYEIPMSGVSEEFADCWRAAGTHLQNLAQGGLHSWLRAELSPPFLEHLSFRLGNQLFFVRLEDADGHLQVPGTLSGLLSVSAGCNGSPCIMPMLRQPGGWTATYPGWGLLHAETGARIDPPSLITDELIEMTDWELHDLAVQTVREQLEGQGREITAWQGNPQVDPSIWFLGDDGLEWVVVRVVRYPELEASPPKNWQQIAVGCARLGKRGHFASVSVANADDAFDPGASPALPLWRGHGMYVRFEGLVSGTLTG